MAKTALIMGAGDYIGRAIALKFAAEGFTVCLARRVGEKSANLVDEIRQGGGVAHAFSCDGRDEEAVAGLIDRIQADIGALDLVICNVGGNVKFPFRETTTQVFRKVWEMACLSGFLTAREAARVMVPRGRGKIFFTGATASLRGSAGYAAFAAAKAGQKAVAQALAKEVGPQGIHVAHLVIDAGVDTAFVRERIAAAGRDPSALPDGSLMDPASVAEAYWYLWSQPRDGWTFELDLRPFRETWH